MMHGPGGHGGHRGGMGGPRGGMGRGHGGGMGHYPPPPPRPLMNWGGMHGGFRRRGGCCGCAIPAMVIAVGAIAGLIAILL